MVQAIDLDKNIMENQLDFGGSSTATFHLTQRMPATKLGSRWNEGNVLSVQMYDQENQASMVILERFPDQGRIGTRRLYSPRYANYWRSELLSQ